MLWLMFSGLTTCPYMGDPVALILAPENKDSSSCSSDPERSTSETVGGRAAAPTPIRLAINSRIRTDTILFSSLPIPHVAKPRA